MRVARALSRLARGRQAPRLIRAGLLSVLVACDSGERWSREIAAVPDTPPVARGGWLETGPGNSLEPADTFEIFATEIRARGTGLNCHAHFEAFELTPPYEVSAELFAELGAKSGVGLVVASDYPNSDRYLRVRHYGSEPWRVSPHPDATIVAAPPLPAAAGGWWKLRLEVPELGAVRVKLWPLVEGAVEPETWSEVPYAGERGGRLGLWYATTSAGRWRSLAAGPIGGPLVTIAWEPE